MRKISLIILIVLFITILTLFLLLKIKTNSINDDYISKKDLDIFKDRNMFELNKILLKKEDINNSSSSKENIARIKKLRN